MGKQKLDQKIKEYSEGIVNVKIAYDGYKIKL
jgi:hypothetical protein